MRWSAIGGIAITFWRYGTSVTIGSNLEGGEWRAVGQKTEYDEKYKWRRNMSIQEKHKE